MTNRERLEQLIKNDTRPILFCDIETTGVMDGSDNRITQIALTYYNFNLSSGAYELQDHLFMLAKANEKSIENILHRQTLTREVAEELVKEELVYNYTGDVKRQLKNCQNRQATLERKLEKKRTPENEVKLNEEKELEAILTIKLEEQTAAILQNPAIAYEYIDDETMRVTVDAKVAEMANAPKLADILKNQGIDLEKWRNEKKGLSFGEIQIGIAKFVDTYTSPGTVVINNGSYFCKHYMEKEHLRLGNFDEIDISKCYSGDWTLSLDDVANTYKEKTGKEIKTFDALTKCLAFAEITSKEIGKPFKNTSEKYLEEQVKLEAAKHKDGDEKDYVLTMSELEHSHIVMDLPRYDMNIPCFSSLEYIDFGSDRRYVDLDRMFEVNDNFEITLEGEKDPIKTWEELEEKIKALNGEISPELLNHIKEKYEEISKDAEKERKEQLEIQYNDGVLSKENMLEEEYEYLDSVHDVSSKEEKMDTKKVDNPDISVKQQLLKQLAEANDKYEAVKSEEQNIRESISKKFNEFVSMVKADMDALKPFIKGDFEIDFNSPHINVMYNPAIGSNPANGRLLINRTNPKDIGTEIEAEFVSVIKNKENWDKTYETILKNVIINIEKKIENTEKSIDSLNQIIKEDEDLDR